MNSNRTHHTPPEFRVWPCSLHLLPELQQLGKIRPEDAEVLLPEGVAELLARGRLNASLALLDRLHILGQPLDPSLGLPLRVVLPALGSLLSACNAYK